MVALLFSEIKKQQLSFIANWKIRTSGSKLTPVPEVAMSVMMLHITVSMLLDQLLVPLEYVFGKLVRSEPGLFCNYPV